MMNNRLQELAKQSCFDEIGKDYSLYFNLTKDKVERFAELIVRECADIADLNDCGSSDEWDKCARVISRDIKEHFGVE